MIEAAIRETGVSAILGPDGWQLIDPADPIPSNHNRDAPQLVERPGEGLPMLGLAGAGPGAVGNDEAEEWFDLNRRWLTGCDALLEVHGESMSPMLREGDLVGIRRLDEGQEPKVGDVAAIWWRSSGEVSVKIWGGVDPDSGLAVILSSNIMHAPILKDPEEAVPRGVVNGVLRLGPLRVGPLRRE